MAKFWLLSIGLFLAISESLQYDILGLRCYDCRDCDTPIPNIALLCQQFEHNSKFTSECYSVLLQKDDKKTTVQRSCIVKMKGQDACDVVKMNQKNLWDRKVLACKSCTTDQCNVDILNPDDSGAPQISLGLAFFSVLVFLI